MIEIRKAKNNSDYTIISDLGTKIWEEHYTLIIGSNQVAYMLGKFQSVAAIETQIKENYHYFILVFDKTPVGYLSIVIRENSLFLSKIYVLSSERGKGIGKTAMDFVQVKARELSLNSISLTVNKNNTNSINAYKKMGFVTVESIVMDIGEGYVMDDYKMRKELD